MLSKKQPGAVGAKTGGDVFYFTVSQNQPVTANLGQGYDTVVVSGNKAVAQVRLTFTSSEVGNFQSNDSGSLLNQDGGLAVRIQSENSKGNLFGAESRFDDEGIRFVSNGAFTFDVRDLVSGTERGTLFNVVSLGTAGNDRLSEARSAVAAYINGGQGNDRLTGSNGDDFLVGGAGNDRLNGNAGNDSFIGGAGVDRIAGGNGDDTAFYNVSTDGADKINLGKGDDTVNVSAAADVTQVRLTFTSSEVGNGSQFDGKSGTNQDGGIAVRVQAENANGDVSGGAARVDDEGTTFVAAAGLTFDVRDLVSGTARGDGFQVVRLGTSGADNFDQSASALSEYVNGGQGADTIITGSGNDFLVGGAGDDMLRGGDGDDSFIAGAGNDTIIGGAGNDTVIVNASTEGDDTVVLGLGDDTVFVSTTPTTDDSTTQVRLTFDSDGVGNDDNNFGTDPAVQLQVEDSTGSPTGAVGRYDDEGVTFLAADGTAFDVSQLGNNANIGGTYGLVGLGTGGSDVMDESSAVDNVYLNGGLLSDTLTGGSGNDYLVGGGGVDYLDGGAGNDKLIGGSGLDYFVFTGTAGNDEILDFRSGKDVIDLSSYGITADNVSTTDVRGDTFVFVDSDANGSVDFTIVVDNSAVKPGDFAF